MFDIADMMVKREPFHTEGKQRVLTPSTPSLVQPLALRRHHRHRQTEGAWPPSISLALKDRPNSPLSPAFFPPSQSAPPLFNHRSNRVAVSRPFLVEDIVAVLSPSLATPTPQGHVPLIRQMSPLIIPYLEVFRTVSILQWRKTAEGLRNSWRLSRVLACSIVSRLV